MYAYSDMLLLAVYSTTKLWGIQSYPECGKHKQDCTSSRNMKQWEL